MSLCLMLQNINMSDIILSPKTPQEIISELRLQGPMVFIQLANKKIISLFIFIYRYKAHTHLTLFKVHIRHKKIK